MRLERVHIDGYGRFKNASIEIAPGFQIIAGPNEQGKSTLRDFIADMLYGQRQPGRPDRYDEGRELRAPWSGNDAYGGALVYALRDGRRFEVNREFHARRESVTISNPDTEDDITDSFPRLKNQEPAFAETHLGLPKSVFLGMATISHITLAHFGDRESLQLIRDKLLSLADSGDEKRSGESALAWLDERIQTIGAAGSRSRPLPQSRAHLMDLQGEYEDVHEALQEVRVIQKQRHTVLEEIGALLHQKARLERDLHARTEEESAARTKEEEELRIRLNSIESELEPIGEIVDFPSGLADEVGRVEAMLEQAERRLARTTEELREYEESMNQEMERLQKKGVTVMKEPDAGIEARLGELEDRLRLMQDRLEKAQESLDHAESKYLEAELALDELPDFSSISEDPVEWFSQLAASYESARKTRDEDARLLVETQRAVDKQKRELKNLGAGFEDIPNFTEAVHEYEDGLRNREIRIRELGDEEIQWTQRIRDWRRHQTGNWTMFAVSIAGAAFFTLLPVFTQIFGFYLGAGFMFLMAAYYGISGGVSRRHINRAVRRMAEIEDELAGLEPGEDEVDPIRKIMTDRNAETPRELEAHYENYVSALARRDELRAQRDRLEKRAREAKDRVEQLFQRIAGRFEQFGETISDEDDVHAASLRLIRQYQEHREAKRRMTEWKDRVTRHTGERKELETALDEIRREDLKLSLEVRSFMRENHFTDESKYESALQALRAYRIRSAQSRQKQGIVDVSQGQIKLLRNRLREEEEEVRDLRERLEPALASVGVSDVETFSQMAVAVGRRTELQRERVALRDAISQLRYPHRNGEDEQEESGAAPTALQIEERLEGIERELDSKRKTEHALHIMMMERTAGLRSLNEVDEERDDVALRMRELELELQAAEHAASVIRDVTKERHARIAPRLSSRASAHLKTITNGIYTEVALDKDMHIRVRIPQIDNDTVDPDRRLSKGTVDQIYFAFRLAMVQCVSEESEPLPMLLDDPFANYDDHRLGRAMALLAEIAETHQVLLFTCREDVVKAAAAVDASILRL